MRVGEEHSWQMESNCKGSGLRECLECSRHRRPAVTVSRRGEGGKGQHAAPLWGHGCCWEGRPLWDSRKKTDMTWMQSPTDTSQGQVPSGERPNIGDHTWLLPPSTGSIAKSCQPYLQHPLGSYLPPRPGPHGGSDMASLLCLCSYSSFFWQRENKWCGPFVRNRIPYNCLGNFDSLFALHKRYLKQC
jgi:hypothetical protein